MTDLLRAYQTDLYTRSEYCEDLARWLRENSLRYSNLVPYIGTITLAPCRIIKGRRFDFDDHGDLCVVHEVIGEDAATVVEIAWPIERPDRAAMALGSAGLGLHWLGNPASYFGGRYLQIFRTPLQWLKATCHGCVILDPLAATPSLRKAIGRILLFEDEVHARASTRHLLDAGGSMTATIKTANAAVEQFGITGAAIQQEVFPPVQWIVPGLIPEGCTILAGRPKLGKSWLALDVAIAVADGRYVLGDRKCPQGDCLYLALEDNQRRLQRRMRKLLPEGTWPERLTLTTEWPRPDDGGLDKIRRWAKSVENPRLVIVDVLAKFRPRPDRNATQYDIDFNAMSALQSLASELGIAIIVVHHVRKGQGDVDALEKVSGTLGLSGAADTTVVLDREAAGLTIYARGRDIAEVESAIQFNKETCRWTILGDAAEIYRTDERTAIANVLADADEPLSPTELSAATKMPSVNVRQLLWKMGQDGEVRKVGRSLYVHPDRADLHRSKTPITTITR